MKFKFEKDKAVDKLKQIGGIGAGFVGTSLLQNKFAYKLGKYNKPDYIDGAKVVAGVAMAASVDRKDDLSALAQDAGVGMAANGAINFAVRKLANYFAKKTGATVPSGTTQPGIGIDPDATHMPLPASAMNNPGIFYVADKKNVAAGYGL